MSLARRSLDLVAVRASEQSGLPDSFQRCFGFAGRGTVVEVLAFLGAFGLLWAGLQSAALELGQLRALHWTREVCLPEQAPARTSFQQSSLYPAQAH